MSSAISGGAGGGVPGCGPRSGWASTGPVTAAGSIGPVPAPLACPVTGGGCSSSVQGEGRRGPTWHAPSPTSCFGTPLFETLFAVRQAIDVSHDRCARKPRVLTSRTQAQHGWGRFGRRAGEKVATRCRAREHRRSPPVLATGAPRSGATFAPVVGCPQSSNNTRRSHHDHAHAPAPDRCRGPRFQRGGARGQRSDANAGARHANDASGSKAGTGTDAVHQSLDAVDQSLHEAVEPGHAEYIGQTIGGAGKEPDDRP